MNRPTLLPLAALLAMLVPAVVVPPVVRADPCGMVPPVYVGDDVPLVRVGVQKTYVFFRGGIETLVIRPGFEGKVEEFGMLIPMPSVPALRKVSDDVFPHIAAAIDPPEVVVDVRPPPPAAPFGGGLGGGFGGGGFGGGGMQLGRDEVVVEKEEAVGMYEVAVLRAGSADALNTWMEDHGYRYPTGMDAACEDYVREGWCFVAVKTKVGAKSNVDPQPGMRKADPDLPAGSTFDGHVQAMGFRFRVRSPVVPMRLSTFNEGSLRNVVYVLTDGPSGLVSIPREYVVRQVPGEALLYNVTQPLPLRILGGTIADLQPHHRKRLSEDRDPTPHNGAAKVLFADDLMAVRGNRLSHPHEEREKMLLRIAERLELRGPDIDDLNEGVLEEERAATLDAGLGMLRGMTLSVVDGNFPREVLANQNLRFSRFRMAERMNTPARYDARELGPKRGGRSEGRLYRGRIGALEEHDLPAARIAAKAPSSSALAVAGSNWSPGAGVGLCGLLMLAGLVVTLRRRSR